ncbi:MAG TPA: cysteine--tRNA ligase, partial [bacterium]|nr:cysteine--tRNA ligase [bacterium]
KKKEELIPLEPGKIKMYVCGITPYFHSHIGHSRCYAAFDIIRRYLIFKGYKVEYIQNFTDIDDKIIASANSEKIEPKELAERYIKSYFEDMKLLNIVPADNYPRVSENIRVIIDFIQKIIDNGYGYAIDGEVFFDVQRFKNYGRLSNRILEEQKAGARVKTDDKKRNPLDFTLWKPSKSGEPEWDSPWSKGRPGWHIECSAMSLNHFPETFDIHGGGQDLTFPHHENEIAQSESVYGKPTVKYWMHNGFVTVNKEKMSKSLNNFFLIKDVLKKYKPEILRYFLASAHYRSPLDFSEEQLESSKAAYLKLKNFAFELNRGENRKLDESAEKEYTVVIEKFSEDFTAAMDDDFNSCEALGIIHTFTRSIMKLITDKGISSAIKSRISLEFKEITGLLGFEINSEKQEQNASENMEGLMNIILKIRSMARSEKNFKLSDFIRDELGKLNIEIRDTKDGVKYIIK